MPSSMHKKLCSSNRFVSSAVCINDFVGLQKSFTTSITHWQSAIVRKLLERNSNVTLKHQTYDGFLIRKKVLSKVSYSRQFRRIVYFSLKVLFDIASAYLIDSAVDSFTPVSMSGCAKCILFLCCLSVSVFWGDL